MVKQKFDLGAPIFGKVKGYAPWPGRVAAIISKNRFGKKIFRTVCLKSIKISVCLKSIKISQMQFPGREPGAFA